ncbi:MAG TPA: hypothetical protein VF152_05135 [Acidimicrobiia bacterium]
MNPRVVLIGFVAVVLAATMTFVVATNEDRVADADRAQGTGDAAASGAAAAVTDGTDGEDAGTAGDVDGHNAFAEHQADNPDHAAEELPDEPLDPATRDLLAQQLTGARDVALRYPTVADAEAAGYYRAGRFVPGAGAHYVSGANGLSGPGPVEIEKPMALIYDGVSPTSRVVGLMYYAIGEDGQPDGFAGPNDHWHRHRGICLAYGDEGLDIPLPVDADASRQDCDAVGGNLIEETAWMLHAWVVPSWESPDGVFSHANANLHCADGTDNTDEIGFCEGT